MTVRSVDITAQQLAAHSWSHDGDPVWVTVRPNLRRIHVLAGDILAALGKRRDVAGKGRNESEDVRLASAWLQAHDARDLVILEAQRVEPRILLSLIKLAAAGGADLWLLHRPPMSDSTHRAISRRADEPASLDQVPKPRSAHVHKRRAEPCLSDAPGNDFHTFVAAVHAGLPEDEANELLTEYAVAARSMTEQLDTMENPQQAVAEELVALLRTAPSDPLLTTAIRGIQVAAWNRDIYVHVDLEQLLNSEERPRIPEQIAGPELLAYRQPHRAVTWQLAVNNVGLDQLAALPISSAALDGSTIDTPIGSVVFNGPFRTALRAQLALRAQACSATSEPLLPYAPKTLSNHLTDAARDLGLPAHGRIAERRSRSPRAWLNKLGITIRPLP